MIAPICLDDLKVPFLLLEGTETEPIYAVIWKILASQASRNVFECSGLTNHFCTSADSSCHRSEQRGCLEMTDW